MKQFDPVLWELLTALHTLPEGSDPGNPERDVHLTMELHFRRVFENRDDAAFYINGANRQIRALGFHIIESSADYNAKANEYDLWFRLGYTLDPDH